MANQQAHPRQDGKADHAAVATGPGSDTAKGSVDKRGG